MLTKEQKELVENNHKLIYYYIHKNGLSLDEYYDILAIGLCKAALNFDESKGIKFKIKDILLLDVFFNPIQKYFIKYMVFTPKDNIIKRLMKL